MEGVLVGFVSMSGLPDSKVLYFGKYVGLARQSSFFLLLSQKKETKETPVKGVPNLTKC